MVVPVDERLQIKSLSHTGGGLPSSDAAMGGGAAILFSV